MRVLICRLSALGDVVHTWPLAVSLAANGHEVGWIVEEHLLPLLASHPAVSRTVTVATVRWRKRSLAASTWREIAASRRAVRSLAADVALDPQGLLKSAIWTRISRARRRVGWSREARRELAAGCFYTDRVVPPPKRAHVVDINLSMMTALDLVPPYGAVPDGRFLLTARAPSTLLQPGVGLLPGSGGTAKRWPLSSWVQLASRLADAGWPTTVIWGPGELPLALNVAELCSGARAAPATDLTALPHLLSRCSAVIGADTGPLHLAAALGVPTLAIMTATDPSRNAPRGSHVRVVGTAHGSAGHGRARAVHPATVSVEEASAAAVALLADVAR